MDQVDYDVRLEYTDRRLVATFQDKERTGKPWYAQFVDRRCGVVWPTLSAPGYYVIYALEEMVDRPKVGTIVQYGAKNVTYPYQFLVERRESDSKRFYELLLADCSRFHCGSIVAPQDRKGRAHAIDCCEYFRRIGREIPMWNCSDFSSMEEGKPLIDAEMRDKTLGRLDLYDRPTMLSDELDGIPEGDDGEGYPAITALCHILTSYRVAPFDPKTLKDDAAERTGATGSIY